MGFGNKRNGEGRPEGKEDVFNKVKFSSVKMRETKRGSPMVNFYLKLEQMQKLHDLLGQLLDAGEDGCKINTIVIEGRDYDSGYCFVNPKEPKQDQQGNGNGERQQNRGNGGFKRQNGGYTGGKQNARDYLEKKRLNDGGQEEQGN